MLKRSKSRYKKTFNNVVLIADHINVQQKDHKLMNSLYMWDCRGMLIFSPAKVCPNLMVDSVLRYHT